MRAAAVPMSTGHQISPAPADRTAFDRVIRQADNWSVYQTWGWGEVRRTLGFKPARYLITAADGLASGLSLQEIAIAPGLKTLLVQGAPGWEDISEGSLKDLAAGLRELGRRHRAVFVALEPYAFEELLPSGSKISAGAFGEAGFIPSHFYRRVKETILIDLRQEETALLAAMRQTHRRDIRRAERLGVEVHEGQRPDLTAFYQFYQMLMQDKGSDYGHPLRYWQKFYEELCEPGYADFLIGRRAGAMESGCFFLRHGKFYQYIAMASDKSSKAGASYRLMWEGIQRARALGYPFLEITYITRAKSGLNHWKSGFGGQIVKYLGPYELVISRARYNFMVFLQQASARLHRNWLYAIKKRILRRGSRE